MTQRRDATMRRLFCGFSLIACVVAWAGTNEFMGYGSGDDLQQALVAAKVDAIHNAGGKAEIIAEAQKDKLLADGGKSENEAYLISYEITEKGESFDGTYVRIKAIISKTEDYKLKDDLYKDNTIRLTLRRNGSVYFDKTFTKATFAQSIDKDFYNNAILDGIRFLRVEPGQGLIFSFAVSYPDSDMSVPFLMTISDAGAFSFIKDENLDHEEGDSVFYDEDGV